MYVHQKKYFLCIITAFVAKDFAKDVQFCGCIIINTLCFLELKKYFYLYERIHDFSDNPPW